MKKPKQNPSVGRRPILVTGKGLKRQCKTCIREYQAEYHARKVGISHTVEVETPELAPPVESSVPTTLAFTVENISEVHGYWNEGFTVSEIVQYFKRGQEVIRSVLGCHEYDTKTEYNKATARAFNRLAVARFNRKHPGAAGLAASKYRLKHKDVPAFQSAERKRALLWASANRDRARANSARQNVKAKALRLAAQQTAKATA